MKRFCSPNALSLAAKDACSKVPCLKSTFEIAHEVTKLVKDSPVRDMKLEGIRNTMDNDCKGIHTFCPTRWTIRGETLGSIVNNHNELMQLWEWSRQNTKDTEMKARIIGVDLGENILRQTDILSKALQNPELSAVEGQELATSVVSLLESRRNDEKCEAFWDDLICKTEMLEVEGPKLERPRKRPQSYDNNSNTTQQSDDPKENFRRQYFEAYDRIIENIKSRFDQNDFKIYATLQGVLLDGINGRDFDTHEIPEMYSTDFDFHALQSQLEMLPHLPETANIGVGSALKMLRDSAKTPKAQIISEVIKLAQIIIVAPAANAVSERSFSSLKLIKTYLRSTMTANRLNNLMRLYVHKDLTDGMDLIAIASEFIDREADRRNVFGKFPL